MYRNQDIQEQGFGVARLGGVNLPPSNSTAPVAAPTLVADTATDLLGRASHLHGLIDRICRVTDRVFGCEPVAGAAGDKPLEPYCDVARLQQAKICLDAAIERLESQVRRVEQF